ncbi:hypothetical protein L2737_06225 [Shewanella electrodiphila]|uniref:Uncharacterized protein n=1 Tax=Shewanella electrodiphila TaxID=934143 RepID=A0ABT0KMU7_9GAMM|nr:hypothetical protein [Shewanella electrodiphila]MCL1044924.1 hypothetical protein [Shewanella electrodiphila]
MTQNLIASFRWFLLSQVSFYVSWVIPFKEEIDDMFNLNFEDNLTYISTLLSFLFLIVSILKLHPKKQSKSGS